MDRTLDQAKVSGFAQQVLDVLNYSAQASFISIGHKTRITNSTLRLLSRASVRYLSTRSIGHNHIESLLDMLPLQKRVICVDSERLGGFICLMRYTIDARQLSFFRYDFCDKRG